MTPSPECIALLRAVAAAPDDDVPRLVFADWLEEHGTTDADAARVEFIRLSCQMKSKQRLSPAEGKWLDANVRRLLPTTMKRFATAKAPDGISRSGRNVLINTSLDPKEVYGEGHVFVRIEFWRGFARRVEYGTMTGTSFRNLCWELADDEPLAVHEPEFQVLPFSAMRDKTQMWVNPNMCCGRAVWERVTGHARVELTAKWFAFYGHTSEEWVAFNKSVVLASISRAMTALAREGTGWPADWATGA